MQELMKGSQILGGGFRAETDYKVNLYDFKRPDKFSKDQIRTVTIMHETFARLATTELSGALRCAVKLHCASVDQLTYGEFVRSIPNPTALSTVHMDPLLGSAVLQIDPAVTFAVIDRLFGGKGRGEAPRRDLTGLEMAALEGIVVRLLAGLRTSWTQILDLRPQLGQIETNPQFAQIVPPQEMVVLVTLEAEVAGGKGMINLCLPFLTIEPIIGRLSAQYWYSKGGAGKDQPAVPTSELAGSAEVFFEADTLSLRDLARLKRGSLVAVPDYAGGKAALRAGGSLLFRLSAARDRRTARLRFTVAESGSGGDLARFAAVGAEGGEDVAASFQKALQPLAEQVGTSLRTIEKRMEELSKRQEELSDQLSFEHPEQDLAEAAGADAPERPFSAFSIADCEALAVFMAQEHPQALAMVLAHLEPALAACVLARLAPELQVEVADRIASIERVAPEVLSMADRLLVKNISVMQSDAAAQAGGVETVVKLLGLSSRSLERHVVESLEKSNPDLAEGIKRRLFVFEDIVLLDPKALSKVLKETDPEDLLLAVKAVPDGVKKHLWGCLPQGEAESLQGRLERMGSVRLSDVEAAQMRIIGVIHRMEKDGRIVVAWPGEQLV